MATPGEDHSYRPGYLAKRLCYSAYALTNGYATAPATLLSGYATGPATLTGYTATYSI